MAKILAAKSPEMSDREKRNMERSRRIAAQGMVLLKNDGILPLRNVGMNVALYGSGARRTVKGGSGSGDVNSRLIINVEQGMKEAGFVVTTGNWMDRYDAMCKENMDTYMAGFTTALAKKGNAAIMDALTNPYKEPDEPEVTAEDIQNSHADTAIYVLAKNSGEGRDRSPDSGDYELSEREQSNLEKITEAYANVIVVLNVGGVIDTKFIRGLKGINAILLMSQAGNIGGYALADILTGKETPSGHLASTWAENYSDYPSADTFSHMNHNLDDEYYEEGIYVGYRYFDSFGITPAYPFGYGLSYTTFSIRMDSVTLMDNHVKILAEVKNTGKEFAGREVVQVYCSAPIGEIEKPYQELAGYTKTKKLYPGEEQKIEISFPVTFMASYDEERAAYVLEQGEYIIRVGSHSRSTHVAGILELDREVITETLTNRIKHDDNMTLMSAKGRKPYSYSDEEIEKKNADRIKVIADEIPTGKKPVYSELPKEIPVPDGEKVTMDMVRRAPRLVGMMMGMVTAGLIAMVNGVNAMVGNMHTAFGITVLALLAFTVVLSLLGISMVKEKHHAAEDENEESQVKLTDFFLLIKENKALCVRILDRVFSGFIWTFLFSTCLYYIKWGICADLATGTVDSGAYGTYSMIASMLMFVPLLLGTIVASPLMKKFGSPIRFNRFLLLLQAIPCGILFILQVIGLLHSLPMVFLICMAITATAIGAGFMPGTTIDMECMDYEIYIHGKDRSALCNAFTKFVDKAQGALANSAVGFLLITIGYVVDSTTGDFAGDIAKMPSMLNWFIVIMGLIPCIFGLIAWFIDGKYPITDEVRADMKEKLQ